MMSHGYESTDHLPLRHRFRVRISQAGRRALTRQSNSSVHQSTWEMHSATVEEARETCGLLIVAGWMLAIVLRSMFGAA